MKKIYSYVLMVTALLIGTNVWADDMSRDDLQELINNAGLKKDVGTVTIKLEADVSIDPSGLPIWLGTESISDDAKSIILDLNGKDIKMTGTGGNHYMILVTHGELLIRNSNPSRVSQIIMDGSSTDNTMMIAVYGSYKSSRWNDAGTALHEDTTSLHNVNTRDEGWFTHVEIGDRVKVVAASSCLGNGLVVDAFGPSCAGYDRYGSLTNYQTNFFNSMYGFAYGVRVDVYGEISFTGQTGTNKAYAIKTNGNLESSLNDLTVRNNLPSTYNGGDEYVLTNYSSRYAQHKGDTLDAPFVHVHSSAKLESSSTSTKSAAIYASGYAKWLIEGTCEGNAGLFVKSGDIDIHDATIKSTATTYSGVSATENIGVSGSGSAIVVNSTNGYAGQIDMTIAGDTKVSADKGYAIEETIPDADQQSQIQHIVIEGGSIEGGEQGAIVVTDKTINSGADVTVYGGEYKGTVQAGTAGTGQVSDLLPKNTETPYHPTQVTVVDPETGNEKTVIVVSQGSAPATYEDPENPDAKTPWSWCAGQSSDDPENLKSVAWTKLEDDTIKTGSIFLDELQINSGTGTAKGERQQLVINNGASLQVERLIMNSYARIIVEAGGKLIVNGTQGISAPSVNNIELRSTANEQAYFLFNPAVTSNKWPNASVVVNTVCKQTGASPWTYIYQRIASPLKDTLTAAPANDFGTDMTKLYTHATNTEFESYLFHWDMAQEKWVTGLWTEMAPFTGYQLANNSQAGGVNYTFSGRLVGNQNGDYRFAGEGFDFFGNSYTAPIYIKNIFDHFNNAGVQAAVWVYDYAGGNYIAITPDDFDGTGFPQWLNGSPLKEIAPFAGFIMKLDDDDAGKVAKLNYAAAIWGNPDVNPSAAAPARHSQETADRVTLRVDAANGKADMIKLVQSDRFSEAFDNGADASKYFSENGVNLYAVTNDGELARVATNDLENTVLAFQAGNATEYTISVPAQSGETFMLRDLVTNQTMAMVAGSTYTFNQEAYSTNNARFEIVAAAKMPTAIDNTEVKANVKGIYTITGQYVGENFEILPAGVYVVNGVKIVK